MHIQVINLDEMPVHMMTCQILVCLTPECYRISRNSLKSDDYQPPKHLF